MKLASFGPAHPTEQRGHVGPELFPLRAFLVRQMGECVLVPDAGQVGIALRVLQPLPGGGARLRRTAVELLGPPGEVFTKPVERLPAQTSLFFAVRLFRVFPRSAPRQRGVVDTG